MRRSGVTFVGISNKLKQTQEILRELIDKIGIDQSILPTLKSKLLENAKTYIAAARLKLSTYTSLVNFEGIYNTASNELQEAFENTKEAKDNFQAIYKTQIIMPEKKQLNVSNPDIGNDSLKKQFEESKGKFESEYNTLARNIEEGERLLNTFHTGQLAHKLLPTVFVTPMLTTKDQLDTQLGERLNSLYNSIRAIGVRKIEILKRVFTEVNRTYRDYLEKINAIDTYFKNPNKGITSGNKASIKSLPSRDYPAKWMTVFNKMLDDQVNNIGLFEQLAKEIDINEMMKQAFISENGTKTATIEDLLDPKSYFDLEFNLKLESGDSNSGSNSQTYSLNALLGLARLSLIEDHNRRGIRIMPIDEAQGLGSNYEMLREIAIEEKYQILTMSIDTAGNINKEEQYMYIFSENKLLDEDDYVPAMGIFNGETITPNIGDFIYEEKD
jgi:exonuclease SbcC